MEEPSIGIYKLMQILKGTIYWTGKKTTAALKAKINLKG